MRVRHRVKFVVLPGWWFELACTGVAAIAVAAALRSGAHLPALLPLVLFIALLLASENSFILYPSSAAVSPSFMVVIAAIAAFGGRGALLGACVVGGSAGLVVELIKKGRYTTVLFNCAQYLLASASAAAAYVGLGAYGKAAAFAGAVACFAVVNFGLVLTQVVLNYHVRPREVWADMRPTMPNYFAFGLLGVLVGLLYRSLDWVSLPLLIIPAIITRKVFASF